MVSKKRKTPVKHKKITVEKHRDHGSVEKKAVVEESPQKQENQEAVLPQPQALVVDSKPEVSAGPPSEQPFSEPQLPQPQEQQPQPQLSEQTTDVLPSQMEPAVVSSTPSAETSQDSSSFSGEIRDTQTQEPEQQSMDEPQKKPVWIIIAIAIFFVLIGGGLWYFRENVMKKASVQDEITPAPSILKNTPTPASDSAKLEVDFSKYKVKILNGSGIRGEAAKVKELLEQEEFLIEEIGNADKLTYEKTIIKAKKEVPRQFLNTLKSVLEETYLIDADEELEDLEDVDVIIIIGSSKQP